MVYHPTKNIKISKENIKDPKTSPKKKNKMKKTIMGKKFKGIYLHPTNQKQNKFLKKELNR